MKLFGWKVRIQIISEKREELTMLGVIIIVFVAIFMINIFSSSSKGKKNNISHHHNSYYSPTFSETPTESLNASFFDGGNDCGGPSFDSGGDCGGSGGGE
jgi:hypothetical protein